MSKYVVAVYRPSNEVFSGSHFMASSDSDFEIFDSLTEAEAVEVAAKYLSGNAIPHGVDYGYDISIVLDGTIVHVLTSNEDCDLRGKGIVDDPGSWLGSSPLLDKILARAAVLLAAKREEIKEKAAEKARKEKAQEDNDEKRELLRLLKKHPELLV